ncbi:VOC family protein [Falsiroseomonas sp. HW251]|uniref:VOC family protein n=1 Tax=Falsiroseomonas sp. HW251 TaxID=3390998 RepID=UPI003D31191C
MTPSLLILYVADVAASARFYETLLQRAPEEASPGFAMFRLPSGLSIGLWARAGGPPRGMEIDFIVDDADAVHADWTARGIPVAEPLSDQEFGRSFVAQDPDGTRLRVLRPA